MHSEDGVRKLLQSVGAFVHFTLRLVPEDLVLQGLCEQSDVIFRFFRVCANNQMLFSGSSGFVRIIRCYFPVLQGLCEQSDVIFRFFRVCANNQMLFSDSSGFVRTVSCYFPVLKGLCEQSDVIFRFFRVCATQSDVIFRFFRVCANNQMSCVLCDSYTVQIEPGY